MKNSEALALFVRDYDKFVKAHVADGGDVVQDNDGEEELTFEQFADECIPFEKHRRAYYKVGAADTYEGRGGSHGVCREATSCFDEKAHSYGDDWESDVSCKRRWIAFDDFGSFESDMAHIKNLCGKIYHT